MFSKYFLKQAGKINVYSAIFKNNGLMKTKWLWDLNLIFASIPHGAQKMLNQVVAFIYCYVNQIKKSIAVLDGKRSRML